MGGFETRTTLTGEYEDDLVVFQEILQELQFGIKDDHIREEANIAWGKLDGADLGEVALSSTETKVPHGLGEAPTVVLFQPRADVRVWESQRRDRLYIYLTASGTADVRIFVGG